MAVKKTVKKTVKTNKGLATPVLSPPTPDWVSVISKPSVKVPKDAVMSPTRPALRSSYVKAAARTKMARAVKKGKAR